MKRYGVLILLLMLSVLPTAAYASHSAAGGAECGTYEVHLEQEMTKGRTDGLTYSVDHTVGCKHLILTGLSAAGRGEAQGNAGQVDRCTYYGKADATAIFALYFDTTVSPDDINVKCSRWTGSD